MKKVLKDSVNNENNEIQINDIGNTLEVTINKIENARNSLDKYIEAAFNQY